MATECGIPFGMALEMQPSDIIPWLEAFGEVRSEMARMAEQQAKTGGP